MYNRELYLHAVVRLIRVTQKTVVFIHRITLESLTHKLLISRISTDMNLLKALEAASELKISYQTV